MQLLMQEILFKILPKFTQQKHGLPIKQLLICKGAVAGRRQGVSNAWANCHRARTFTQCYELYWLASPGTKREIFTKLQSPPFNCGARVITASHMIRISCSQNLRPHHPQEGCLASLSLGQLWYFVCGLGYGQTVVLPSAWWYLLWDLFRDAQRNP